MKKSKNFLCIHGHFYQPPRENAWLEEIEIQPSAYPYHDWNERINEECYNANTHSRMLYENGKIIDIVNNYEKISFNFGPTLLSWLEKYAKDTYQGILEADKKSIEHFNGHGNAIAQVYNHLIMPLANKRDKETQIIWGIYDFQYRFKRKPEGIWLAETAVDLETLDLLTKHGITFTILAPRQAKRFRRIGGNEWYDGVDTNQHYLCKLPSGRSITLFFYDGDRSQGVAFEGLLNNGRKFAERLTSGFRTELPHQLVSIATDGESYGHHHQNGDMALAYCIRYIEENNLARITNYAEYASLFEPDHEIEIHENSSWSCVHGVERWKSNCGCHTGGDPGWNQEWREPLRKALDDLREELAEIYEKHVSAYFDDPWEVRDRYIEVIINRNEENTMRFLRQYNEEELDEATRTMLIRMLEMQRHAQLMYTSCGWFFNDFSGIETVQILQYANRAMQIVWSETGINLETDFLETLHHAVSNIADFGTGKQVYERFVLPYQLSLTQVGMHYAVSSLFADDPFNLSILNYDCFSEKYERITAGIQKLAIGTTQVNSKVTFSRKKFSFVVLYMGQHHIIGGTAQALSEERFVNIARKLKDAFDKSNLSMAIDLIKTHFKSYNFSFFSLFKDEQIKMLEHFLTQSEEQAYDSLRKIYDINYNLLNVMNYTRLTIPSILKKNIELVVNKELRDVMEDPHFSKEKFINLVAEIKKWSVEVDTFAINKSTQRRLEALVEDFTNSPVDLEKLQCAYEVLKVLDEIQLRPNLSNVQNMVFKFCRRVLYGELVLKDPVDTMNLMEDISDIINIDLLHMKSETVS
jgi:alpha-amylase/alpha-mannosidase (GH57 family)